MRRLPKVAAIQLVSRDNIADNLNRVERYLKCCVEEGVQLVVLPENFAYMGNESPLSKYDLAEVYQQGPIQSEISRWAKTYSLWIIAGSIRLKGVANNRLRSSSLVFNEQGVCVARYDKIHLFDVQLSATEFYKESDCFEPGIEMTLVDTPIGKVGLSICYDLRFPELYRQLATQGAEVLVVPSAFTVTTGKCHWETLLKARAIENMCYVVAPNQGGKHANGRETFGHTSIISPWGDLMAQSVSQEGIITAEIDLPYLYQTRERLPCLTHITIQPNPKNKVNKV